MDRAQRSGALLALFFALQMGLSAVPAAAADPPTLRTASFEDSWWDEYHPPDDVYELIATIAREHSDIVRTFAVGNTYESRPLTVVKVSDNPGTDEPDEPDVLIIAGTHAREWTTYHAAAYLLNYLTSHYRRTPDGLMTPAAPGTLDNDSFASWLIDNREIYVLPMVNPDGIHFAHTQDNLWRKNREPNPGFVGYFCTGTDINRNYDWHWGELQGDSHVPCADDYAGPARADGLSPIVSWRPGEPLPGSFSTAEARGVRDLQLAHDFQTALSLHSYSGLVLYPWGYTADAPPDIDDYVAMADVMANMTGYIPQSGYDLYKTAGVWDDWSYGVTGAYSFTIEMGHEFQPPAEEILMQAELVLGPELYLAEVADDLHLRAPTVMVSSDAAREVDPNMATPVVAHVDAIDGVADVQLVFSTDGGKNWRQAPMAPRGTDGTFEGALPGLRPGASAVYYVSATDSNGITRFGPQPAPYQAYEVHARNGVLDQIGFMGLVALLGGAALAGALLYVKFLRGRPFPAMPALKLPKVPRRTRAPRTPRARRAVASAKPAPAAIPPRDGRGSSARLQAFIDSVDD